MMATVSEATELRMTGPVRGFATGVKETSEGQSHGAVVYFDGRSTWLKSGEFKSELTRNFRKKIELFYRVPPDD